MNQDAPVNETSDSEETPADSRDSSKRPAKSSQPESKVVTKSPPPSQLPDPTDPPEPVDPVASSVQEVSAAHSTDNDHGQAHGHNHSNQLPPAVRYGISALIIGGAIAGFFVLMSFAEPVGTKDPTALVQQVRLEKSSRYTGPIDLTVSGTVVPHQEINIAAEVSGRVSKKFPACSAGNFVKKDTPLIQIDPESYQLAFQTIAAELNQADKRLSEIDKQIDGEKRNLQLAQQDLDIQRREYERSKRLGSAISRSELDQARRSVNAAQVQVAARENTIMTLGASRVTQEAAKNLVQQRLESAQLDLRRTKVIAPVDGVIVTETVQQDDYVRQGDNLLQLENTQVAEVRCNLTTSDLDWIRSNSADADNQSIYQLPKTAVTIYDADEPNVTWDGVLERFSGIGRDPVTKTIPCRIIVKKPVVQGPTGPRALVRGMYVKCNIEVETSNAASITGSQSDNSGLIAFNERALQPNKDVWFVRENLLYRAAVQVVDRVVVEDSATGVKDVTIIASVNSGELVPGDAIVVSPLSQPTVGTEVVVFGSSEKAAAKSE